MIELFAAKNDAGPMLLWFIIIILLCSLTSRRRK